jgi:hypothetical protein
MNLVIFLLCSLAICYAWSDTDVSVPARNLVARIPYINKPLLCHECSSFWISLGLSFLINPLESHTYPLVSNVLSAFCGFFINLYFVRKHIIPFKDTNY